MKTLLLLLLASVFTMSATTGIDSFEIYLNNKLLLRHTMSEPLTLQSLKLTQAKANDELKIRYMQCNAPGKIGKNRKLSIVDEQGRMVKEWKFKDSDDENNAMVIPVKELLAEQKKSNGKLVLTYTADDFGKAQQLAAL